MIAVVARRASVAKYASDSLFNIDWLVTLRTRRLSPVHRARTFVQFGQAFAFGARKVFYRAILLLRSVDSLRVLFAELFSK